MKNNKNNKNKILTIVAFSVLALMIISGTYAFFAPQTGGTTSTNATVTSNTTDLLTFSINRDISFTVTQDDFQENGTNKSGDATATAILTPNNKTGSATMNYYLYLNLQSNPTVYSESNTNEDPELMLQVFDGNNQLVTLTGLGTQKTIKGVTGYDITGVSGLKTLLNNHAISASNNTATIENWRIVITLINLDVNQNDNTGKEVSAEIIIQKEELSLGFTGTIYRNNTVTAGARSSIIPVIGTQWVITDGIADVFNYDTQLECTSALTGYGNPTGYTCEEKSGTFGGVGSYETNVNTIRTATYNVYCPIGGNNLTCGNNWYYNIEQDCLDNVDTSEYTCTPGSITKTYYLKHIVENNIIQESEVCLWYNNHEFCLGPNYWVENDADGSETELKLKNDIENGIGLSVQYCSSDSETADCTFTANGFSSCFVDVYGNAFCRDGSESCGVQSIGLSMCYYN